MNSLQKMSGWPEKVKTMQNNWIGKSKGCEVEFKIINEGKEISQTKLDIFTPIPFGSDFL